MTIYSVTVGRTTRFQFSANLAEASAPIELVDEDGEATGGSTPFQTADARHSKVAAAEMLIGWLRNEGGGMVGEDEDWEVKAE